MLVTQTGRPRAASSQPSAATAHPGHDGGTKDGMSKPLAGVSQFWERHSSWNMEEEQDFTRREGVKGCNTLSHRWPRRAEQVTEVREDSVGVLE